MDALWKHSSFTVRRKILAFPAAKFQILDDDNSLIGMSKQKAFKLKEDLRLYGDEQLTDEILTISARSVIDFSAAYDVVDAKEGRKVGALRRKGFSSMVRDAWEILDENDEPIAKVQEDAMWKALVRRLLTNLVPQKFIARDASGAEVASFSQNFNPFNYRLQVDRGSLEPRMAVATGLLLAAIEGRQES